MSGPSVTRIHTFPDFGPLAGDSLERSLGVREIVALSDEDAFVAALPDMEVLFTFRPPAGHWALGERLRLVQLSGAGVDGVLPAPDLSDDVALCNALGIHLPEMSEFVLGMVMALHLQVPRLLIQQRSHEWSWVLHPALAGRRAVVVGLGHIGEAIAHQLAANGLRVDGVRRSGDPVEGIDRVLPTSRLAEVLEGADVLVVVAPLTDETRGLIGADELALLAPGALLVDVSRGGITSADAVVEALGTGRLGGAALDVFETEPLPADSALWDVPGLIVTPHIAAIGPDYLDRLVGVLAENVRRLEEGDDLLHVVDRARGY